MFTRPTLTQPVFLRLCVLAGDIYARSQLRTWCPDVVLRCSTSVLLCPAAVRRMSSNGLADLSTPRPVVGVVQLTAKGDKEENFHKARALVERCKAMGAQMVFLPEACDYIAETKNQSMDMAESLQGEVICNYQQLAQELSLWISLVFHQKSEDADCRKLLNTHVILDSQGKVRDTYHKIHLFDLDIPDRIRLLESDYTIPGHKITSPVDTPVGKVGMGICYDMRFPELAIHLRNQGAQILTYPSVFTVPTGKAHWEVLLRNRAIESQCYVIAAAQVGQHNNKRASYGHSMVVDPWGTVVAECRDGEDVCVAEVDLQYLDKVRTQMPVQRHRRHDLYGHIRVSSAGCPDSVSEYDFGGHKIGSGQVFYKTGLSYAFVNIKPVVPGHVLVASLRSVPHLNDLDPAEIADLFNTANTVAEVVKKHYGASSGTVAVQDGPAAGQTVQHVHVHVLPRKNDDFPENDDVYKELQDHDKHLEEDRAVGRLRSEEQMNEEATQLRAYFTS